MSAMPLEETGEVTRKRNLFEIGEELERVFDAYHQMVENGEDAESWLSRQLEQYFNCTAEELDAKVDAYAALIKRHTAYGKICRAEAASYAAKAQANENLAERLKKRIQEFMGIFHYRKLETPRSKVSICGNGGVQPLKWRRLVDGELVDTELEPDVAEVEDRFTKRVLDVAAVRAALDAGEDLPFARLAPRGEHVRVA